MKTVATYGVAAIGVWKRDDGQDMVEYALLLGLLSMIALALIILVGPEVKSTFQYLINGLASA